MGDARDLDLIEDESIDLIATHPPMQISSVTQRIKFRKIFQT